MKKGKKELECFECDVKFTLTYKGKQQPQCCPFCGEGIHVTEERPLLNDFEQYDTFEDADYFSEDEEFDYDEEDE
jgi:peptide subunit release factor 1 (eRF1)